MKPIVIVIIGAGTNFYLHFAFADTFETMQYGVNYEIRKYLRQSTRCAAYEEVVLTINMDMMIVLFLTVAEAIVQDH